MHAHIHTEINKVRKKEREKNQLLILYAHKTKMTVRLHFSSLHLCTSTLLFLPLFQKINIKYIHSMEKGSHVLSNSGILELTNIKQITSSPYYIRVTHNTNLDTQPSQKIN